MTPFFFVAYLQFILTIQYPPNVCKLNFFIEKAAALLNRSLSLAIVVGPGLHEGVLQ